MGRVIEDVRFQPSEGMPWAEADRRWFKGHKTRDFYVRPRFKGEGFIGGLSIDLRAFLEGKALDAGSPARSEIRVIVFQVSPNRRARLPFLWWEGKGLDKMWYPTHVTDDGKSVFEEVSCKELL